MNGIFRSGGWFGYGMGMWAWWILIIAGAVGIVWFVMNSQISALNKPGNNGKSAQDLLKERYAKGEITKKEFDRINKDL